MKARLLSVAVACAAALSADAHAQAGAKAQRSPEAQALQGFSQVLNDPKGKFDQARFQKVMEVGFAFLVKYPTHEQAPAVAFDLGGFGARMSDKATVAMRPVYTSQLNYEVLNQSGKDGLSPEARTAIAAVGVALADFEARVSMTRDTVSTLRDKIDALARMPAASRYLSVAERSFADVLSRGGKSPAGEAHLKKLLNHPDKELAAAARDDLNFIEMRKEPFAAKFTGLDGKECDFAQLRGKVVAVVYFRSGDNGVGRYFESLKAFHTEARRSGFEIVAVSHDPAADGDKLKKWVADQKVTWPVYFDGKGSEGDFAPKIVIRNAPSVAIFDQKGMLLSAGLAPQQLEPAVRQILGLKAPEPEQTEMPAAGGGRRR